MTKGYALGWKAARRAGLFLLSTAAFAGAAGCDTVAEISIENTTFEEIVAVGVINSADCAITDTQVELRFGLLDGRNLFLSPGRVTTDPISVGGSGNFRAEDITFGAQTFMYPSPDIACTGDGDCPAPYDCVPINPSLSGSETACGMEVSVQAFQGSLAYEEGSSEQKRSVLLMDFSESLSGINAEGDFDPSCATDPADERVSAARAFVLRYERVSSFSEDSRFCVAKFSGDGPAGTFFLPSEASCLTGDYDTVVSQLGTLTVGEEPGSPMWAAVGVVAGDTSPLTTAAGDRSIILFTDGLDDAEIGSFQEALAAVQDEEIEVHVVQLDTTPNDETACGFTAIGPEDELARLACETGGTFQYASDPATLRPMYTALAHTLGEYYTVRLEVPQLGASDIDPGRYRIATTMTVNLLGETQSISFAGDQTDPASADIVDTRLTVFKRPVPARPVPDEGDGTGEETEG